MFELSVGYVIGMVTGYIIFKSSVKQAHDDLKDYLDEWREQELKDFHRGFYDE